MDLNIFVLCDQEEYPRLKKRIDVHFCVMEGDRQIKVYHEGQILPGENEQAERLRLIKGANIVILMLTPDLQPFLYREKELYTLLLDRMFKGDLLVLPVFYRPTHYEDWFYKKLTRIPSDLPITLWSNDDLAWTEVQKLFIGALDAYRELCNNQKLEFEKLRATLSSFNFSQQFAFLESSIPTFKQSTFQVFVIQGTSESGHNLLMHRLRRYLNRADSPHIHTVNLQDGSVTTGEIWLRLMEFFEENGNRTPIPDALMKRLLEDLEEGPRSIVFEDVEFSFQCEVLTQFFKELSAAYLRISLRKSPDYRCCFFVLNRNYLPPGQVAPEFLRVEFPEVQMVHLPPISPVTLNDLENWAKDQLDNENLTSDFIDRLKKQSLIIPNSETDNAVMPVLKRVTHEICGTRDMTEAIYDRYLATLQ